MTKYRLKLPLPGVPAGTESNPSGNNYHIYSGPILAFSFSLTEMDDMPDFFEKVEEPKVLYITEDGVDIYENTVGSVFGICIDSKTDIWLERKLPWTSKNGMFAENRMWFYYAEQAMEYLVCNYPCLSSNEINCDPLNTRKLVRNKLKALLPDIF